METIATARIEPDAPPFAPEVQAAIDRVMPPGRAPLRLFTTLARDARLATRFFAGGLLDRGHLTLRQRELMIDRTTARCGSEYEWGVHMAIFGARVGIDAAQAHSLVNGSPEDACWSAEDRLVLQFADTLHDTDDVDDALWHALRERFSAEALIELVMLAGSYHTVSWLTKVLRLPLEADAARFPPR
jgi:alkylhydroperoxidase family enzyme